MFLLAGGKKNYFDKIQKAIERQGANNNFSMNASDLGNSRFYYPFTIIKQNSKQVVLSEVGNQFLGYFDTTYYNWSLMDEAAVIDNIPCRKALCKSKDNVIKIWYATDLPLHDGPGLVQNSPGLIVRYESTSGLTAKLLKISYNNTMPESPHYTLTTQKKINEIRANYSKGIMNLGNGVTGELKRTDN